MLVGRCVSYGEGATYLPLRQMVEQVGDLSVPLEDEDDSAPVAQRVLELVGLAEGAGVLVEGLWAVRRLFEALARPRSLLLVVEDVHWAEPTLLDLVEQVAERAAGPILILCIARPEVFDERPGWREAAIELAPLPDQHLQALVSALPGGQR